MGVDRYWVCELYAAGPDTAGSGSGYRLGGRLVLTAWHVVAATLARPGRPVMLVTGGGGAGKTRLGREACVQMLVARWDAGLADDTRRDGTATDRLARPTLLVVDDPDLCTCELAAVESFRPRHGKPPLR